MSSTRTKAKTPLARDQFSRTHCGPSTGTPVTGSRCQVPSFGGSGYGPPRDAGTVPDISSVPSALRPVAISRGTSTNEPSIWAALPGTKSSYFVEPVVVDLKAHSLPWSFQTASAFGARYA